MAEIKTRYDHLVKDRTIPLERGRDCAELTIPRLLPPERFDQDDEVEYPYQSLGARGVTNLSARLMLALFPPPPVRWMQLAVDMNLRNEVNADDEQIQDTLTEIENPIIEVISRPQMRSVLASGMDHLAVSGNGAFFVTPNLGLRYYRMDKMTIVRDGEGMPYEVVVCDRLETASIDPEIKAEADIKEGMAGAYSNKHMVLYTRCRRVAKDKAPKDPVLSELLEDADYVWVVDQEINDTILRERTEVLLKCPFICPRWKYMPGENYSRGYVEDLLGDLRSYDGLAQSLLEMAAISADVTYLVDPNGITRKQDLINRTGRTSRYVPGRADDVQTLQPNVAANMQPVVLLMQDIEERLGYAFVLNSAVQPSGERVTAYQIQQIVSELNGALGNVYVTLAHELQTPLVEAVMERMAINGIIPVDAIAATRPQIIAGLEAVSREQEAGATLQFVEVAASLNALNYVRIPVVLKKMARGLNVDAEALVRSDEEVAEMQQQAQLNQQTLETGGAVVQAAAQGAANQQR